MIHRHDWQIQRVDEMPSAFDQLKEGMERPAEFKGSPIMFRRKIVYWLKCLRCGKVKKVVEENP